MSTIAVNTDVSIPVLSSWTDTFLDRFVVELASWAVDGADVTVVSLTAWALALVGNVVVDSSSSTSYTGDSVPCG